MDHRTALPAPFEVDGLLHALRRGEIAMRHHDAAMPACGRQKWVLFLFDGTCGHRGELPSVS
jgi:hypothetical protein